jgi:hypothetical protein
VKDWECGGHFQQQQQKMNNHSNAIVTGLELWKSQCLYALAGVFCSVISNVLVRAWRQLQEHLTGVLLRELNVRVSDRDSNRECYHRYRLVQNIRALVGEGYYVGCEKAMDGSIHCWVNIKVGHDTMERLKKMSDTVISTLDHTSVYFLPYQESDYLEKSAWLSLQLAVIWQLICCLMCFGYLIYNVS